MKTQLIGITGGIGSGKSYVCDIFKRKYGIEIFNTDQHVQSVTLKKHSVKREVIAKFGEDSYLADGRLNKDKFKTLIKIDAYQRILYKHFNNYNKFKDVPTPLQLINQIVAPELRNDIKAWGEYPRRKYALVECAVLYEAGLDDLFDNVIVVICPIDIRFDRLEKRGMEKDMIDAMILNQWDDKERLKRSKLIIGNSDFVEDDVDVVHNSLDF
jgi:dephospho-CoA kinase